MRERRAKVETRMRVSRRRRRFEVELSVRHRCGALSCCALTHKFGMLTCCYCSALTQVQPAAELLLLWRLSRAFVALSARWHRSCYCHLTCALSSCCSARVSWESYHLAPPLLLLLGCALCSCCCRCSCLTAGRTIEQREISGKYCIVVGFICAQIDKN